MRAREEDRERAGDVRDAPAVVADVGERQRDDGEREAEAAGERQHRRGVRARAFGCLFDHRDAGDDQGRVHARALQHLRGGEDLDRRRDGRDPARDRGADDPEQDRAAAAPPVGERGREDRDDRARPASTASATLSLASETPNVSPIGSAS